MKNKGLLIALTVVVLGLCLFYLSFTFVSRSVEKDADEFAMQGGKVNPRLRQAYLDSVFTTPVFSLGFAEFTYKEVKEKEVKLGLDLVGGMHVTMEVSAPDIVSALAGNTSAPAFTKALAEADAASRTNQAPQYDWSGQGGRYQSFFCDRCKQPW